MHWCIIPTERCCFTLFWWVVKHIWVTHNVQYYTIWWAHISACQRRGVRFSRRWISFSTTAYQNNSTQLLKQCSNVANWGKDIGEKDTTKVSWGRRKLVCLIWDTGGKIADFGEKGSDAQSWKPRDGHERSFCCALLGKHCQELAIIACCCWGVTNTIAMTWFRRQLKQDLLQ